MPVRGIFVFIGAAAILGIGGALVVREMGQPLDSFSQISATARETGSSRPEGSSNGGFFGSGATAPQRTAQATSPASRVILPGSQPPTDGTAATPPAQTSPAGAAAPAAPAAGAPAATPAPAPAATPAPTAAAPARPDVDETALRYFARQGDTRRLEAEIARLRALYPDWYPPADMTAPVPVTDPLLDNMWKLYSEGQYAAARAAIAERQAREPGWTVPADLLARLDVGEARERLVNAAGAKQWNTVVSIAAATPSLLTCADVEVLWDVSEAFARTERPDRARDVGVYILTNCQEPQERLATVQKAMQYLANDQLNDLLALERRSATGEGEFASVKGDLARRRVGAAARDPNLTASADDLALLEQLATNGTKADDAVLLGSYLFQHKDPEGAVKWFQLAKTRADTPEIARGLAYALNELDRPAEAEAAAYRWRDSGPENKEAYLVVASALLAIDPPARIEPDVMARMAKVISEDKYTRGAQELGWYAYNTGQTLAAARWFTAALTWKPDDEPSAFGLALAYDKLGNRAAVQQILRVWGPRSERIAMLGDPNARRAAGRQDMVQLALPPSIANPAGGPSTVLVQPTPATPALATTRAAAEPVVSVEAAPAPAARPARRATQAAAPAAGGSCSGRRLSSMNALSRGWCLMDLNRPIEAADAFDEAMQSGSERTRQDAAYGKTLANLRSGLTDAAAVSAAAVPQNENRDVEMRTEILTQRALQAYNDQRYTEALLYLDERSRIAPEQNDLLLIRAWSYYHLHRVPEAKRIFVAVAGTGSREALRALATIANSSQGDTVGDVRDRR